MVRLYVMHTMVRLYVMARHIRLQQIYFKHMCTDAHTAVRSSCERIGVQ